MSEEINMSPMPELPRIAFAEFLGAQFVEQGLGLLQIERVKAFGEPAID